MERGELSTLTSLALALVPIAVFLGALIFMFGDRSATTTGDLARAAHAYTTSSRSGGSMEKPSPWTSAWR
jgi:hypothetical protein